MKHNSPQERIRQAANEAEALRHAEKTKELNTNNLNKKQIFEALDVLNQQGPTHKIEILYDTINPKSPLMKALFTKMLTLNSFTLSDYTGSNFSEKRVHVGREVEGWVVPNTFSTTTTPPSGPYTVWSHLVISTQGDFWRGGLESIGGEGLIYGIEGDPFLSRKSPRLPDDTEKLKLTLEAIQTLATNPKSK